MNAVIINGQRKNPVLDAIAWLLVIGILAGIPLLVGALRTPPVIGPVKDPSILIIFLSLMGLIALSAIPVWVFMAKDRLDQPFGLNSLNFHAKLIGALFIISGFVKLQDPVGFSYKLDEYWDVFETYTGFFPADFMKSFSLVFGALMSILEVTFAIALMTGWRMRITGTVMMLMILFFTFLTGFSAITGSVTDCGCFGDALKLTPWQTFMKDILLTFAIFPFFWMRRRIYSFYKSPIPAATVAAAFIIPAGISYYTYQHYPLLDFRGAYVVGQDLSYNAVNFDQDELIAHDFFEFAADCDHDGFKGPTLYIIMYNLDKAPAEAIDAAATYTQELKQKAPGIFVVGATNTGKSVKAKLPLKFDADFCWSSQDEKVLKTIVRSSPGYVLLNDGKILGKWHYNDLPSVETLKSLAGPAASIPIVKPVDPSATSDSLAADTTAPDSAK